MEGTTLRGAYQLAEIEYTLDRYDIPYDWTELTWLETEFFVTRNPEKYVYILFDIDDPTVPVLNFECRVSVDDDWYYIYVNKRRRLLTGLLYEYEKARLRGR